MINVTQSFLPPLEEYVAQLQRIWNSKWLTNRGELVRELEENLEIYLNLNNLLIVNNGTIALQLAMKALDLKGEVITTPFSYVATVSSIVWEGATPVFADIDPKFLTIDETKIEAAITEKTSAILATHIYGNPCNVEAIQDIAERHNLKVIYDAAHCFGVKYKGESILNWGDISTLSFHATKLFHTGEGGGVVCRDPSIAHKVYYMHNFGHNVNDTFWGVGINGKISEFNAAIGLCVLPHIEEIVNNRRNVSNLYDQLLQDSPLEKPAMREEAERNYAYYPVLFPSEDALLKTTRALAVHRISPRRYFYPSLENLPYLEKVEMPISADASRRVLCLPLYAELEESDVRQICRVVNETLNG